MDSPNADSAQEELRAIRTEFAAFCAARGFVTEADTRVKIIDRVLTKVCGWPELAISREEHISAHGYMDYVLSVAHQRLITVEAKRAGLPFTLPVGYQNKSLKLTGALFSDKDIKEAIHQVRSYCDEAGIKFAVATNGYSWIVFRALRDDGSSWRQGTALLFSSLDDIIDRITEFWNLLSYEAVKSGALDIALGPKTHTPRRLHRVIDRLFNADLPLQRNKYASQLDPLVRTIFEDIAEQDQIEILQSCYVYSGSLKIAAERLDHAITDSIPLSLRYEGAKPLYQSKFGAGDFDADVQRAMQDSRGDLLLLLGGIGCGKTTFMRRYQKTVGKELLDSKAIWFHVDFLKAPLERQNLEPFVWQIVLNDLRLRYGTLHLESRDNLKELFSDNILALTETVLRTRRPGSAKYETALSTYLAKWQENLSEYLPRLLSLARTQQGAIVFFIDNVDQLPPELQADIFLLAQRVTRLAGSTTIVALREESYYQPSIRKVFSAYTNRKFHIASPKFRILISNRIKYALKVLNAPNPEADSIVPSIMHLDREALTDFLTIVQHSVFQRNRNIAVFIESICFGNMRDALEMFVTFLTSGVTDVDKMLRIYRWGGDTR